MDKLLDFDIPRPGTEFDRPSAIKTTAAPTVSHSHKIHIRSQQMGSKWITMIEDLDEDLDLKRIARYMKRSLNCAVAVCEDTDSKEYIKIQGNKKQDARDWLVANEVLTEKEAKERLVLHGV
jgi:translation initiation factor 1